jgi:very-short-patch-repair endonuclease
VVSIRQLETLFGYSDGAVRKAVTSGRLHPLHRGVYAVGHRNLSLHGHCLAAVLAAGPGSLLSYYSAGWLWGLVRSSPRPFHVTAPTTRRLRNRPPIRIHRARNLVEDDRALVEGVPVTAVARTLLDLAEQLKENRLPRVLERAEELKLLDADAASAACERSSGHRGSKRLMRALALYRRRSMTRSELERRFHALIAASDLPQPHANFVEVGYELDAYWPHARFGVELDTYETHGSRLSFETDRERDAALAEAGITTIRITERRLLEDPAAVLRQVATILAKPAAAPRHPASPPSPA